MLALATLRVARLVLMAAIVGWQAPAAWAFGFEDKPTRWPKGRTIEFTVNLAHVPANFPEAQYLAYLRKALEPWAAIPTASLPFAIGSTVNEEAKADPQADGVNMIFWKPGFVPRDQFAGKAYPFRDECDILIAPRPPFTLIDIQAIVMHELGHCMGLAHSTALSVMTKFSGLPSLSHDDRVAVSLLYPNRDQPLEDATATIRGKVVHRNGDPIVGAVLRVIDGQSRRIILAGFSGLVDAQNRREESGAFELPGLPPGQHRLQVEPMDAFAAADPNGYGAPTNVREPFLPVVIDLPELEAGDTRDVGTIRLEE